MRRAGRSAPPMTASVMLSISKCRARRMRPAPSARRTANSRCRVHARMSRRLAIFAHAISNRPPTATKQNRDRAFLRSVDQVRRAARPHAEIHPPGGVGQCVHDRLQLASRHVGGHARAQSSECFLACASRFDVQRQPDLGIHAVRHGNAHVDRRDADDGSRSPVNGDDLSDDVASTTIPLLPESVSDHHDGWGAEARVVLRESAPHCWRECAASAGTTG